MNIFFRKVFFNDVIYPWEVISHLKRIIERLVETRRDEYERYSDGILIGKNTHISRSAIIEAPAIIGNDCEIRHGAYLRGSVAIGDGCVIGNSSEIKNSIMMDGSQAPHFNYIGDSILGAGAHLGAGAICSNLRSDKKSAIIKTSSCIIDTKMRKLGAILGDNVEIGCGAVLCPGVIIGKRTAVYPLTLARGIYPADSIVKQSGDIVVRI